MLIYLGQEILFFLLFFVVTYAWGIHPARDMMLKHCNNHHGSLEGNKIRILCWNIGKNKRTNWKRDFSAIYDTYDPQIMMLQEVKMDGQIESLFKDNLLAWRFLPNIIHIKKQLYSGVLTASTARPVSENFHKSLSTEPITFTPKATLFTCYDLAHTQEKLLVINIHGINFVSLRHFRNQIHEIVEHGIQHVGPIIFCGDFNTWSKNRVKFLEKVLQRKLDLIPIFFEKKHSKKIKNFIFSPPLDHIFYSHKSLKLVKNSSTVLRQYRSSDHKPIFAEFQIREKPDSH